MATATKTQYELNVNSKDDAAETSPDCIVLDMSPQALWSIIGRLICASTGRPFQSQPLRFAVYGNLAWSDSQGPADEAG